MTVHDILTFVETLAPLSMKYDWDNVGLLCGSAGQEVHKILVALDPFEGVCREAAAVYKLKTIDVGNLRQSCQHALSGRIAQPPVYIIFHIKVGIDAVIFQKRLFQLLHIPADLT